MRQKKYLGSLPWAMAAFLFLITGCSHAVFPTSGGNAGGNNAPMILTFHDTPPSGITLTSFEVTVTGAVLQPGNVSLLASPQTIELTQLQANSILLSTTQVPVGSYTSLTVTYSNPQFTFLNDSGVSVSQTCSAGASCVVASPTISGASTITLSNVSPFPVVTTTGQTTLLEVDVNLNNIIQSNFSLNFASSGAVTALQQTSGTPPTAIDSLTLSGTVTSVGANQFNLTASTGQSLTVAVDSSTAFEFQRAKCAANNFTCLVDGQVVDVSANILTDGSLEASEVDFDDAANTQQVSGTIVSFNTTPPTSFQMIVHNSLPAISTLSVGTPVTVTIGNTASYVINNGALVLPTGVTFASNSDLLVGQEVEARVSGTLPSGSSPSYTTDRIALEPAQINAAVSSVSPGTSVFVLSPLPPLFSQASSNTVLRIQVLTVAPGTTPGTVFQDLPQLNVGGLTVGQSVSVGGFLFNTIGTTGSPTVVAETVRGVVAGT